MSLLGLSRKMVVLAPILSIVIMLMAYFLHHRILRNQKPSVTDTQDYRKLAAVPMTLYINPLNYKRKGGKLIATSSQLVLMEKTISAKFSDKIPWCLPPTYGDLEMNGAFPSMKTCRLEALCRTMMENIDVFRTEFNANKAEFDENPEKLGYGSRYGRIVLNDVSAKFPKTRKVLNQSADFARTQRFIEYASGSLFSTMFTVLEFFLDIIVRRLDLTSSHLDTTLLALHACSLDSGPKCKGNIGSGRKD